jgi:multiple sugar transport system substrate-binding protein
VPRYSTKLALIAAAGWMAAHSPALAQEKLTVWWTKGFYKSEDDALLAAVKKFERQAGVSVDLSQYPVQDMIPKTVSALDAGTPPDVGFADVYDFQVTGKWAFEGKPRGSLRRAHAHQGKVRTEYDRDHVSA